MRLHNRIPPVRYVTMFPGRCGSTYLTDHLGDHPNVVANYEILSQYPDSWAQQKSFLDEMIQTRRNPQVMAIGLKTKLRHLRSWTAFAEYLHQNRFRVIHLTRANQLKMVVSIVRAEMLRKRFGTSNLIRHDQQPIEATAIPIPAFSKARRRLKHQLRLQRFVDQLDLPKLKLTYEDLLRDEESVLRMVWDFLNVRPLKTSGRTRKNTPQDIRRVVTNLDEILDHFPDMACYADQC